MANQVVIVIGGGIGGLSTAIHLAKKKCAVILFEKNDKVGGKMGEIRQDGFRWDIGPSVVTMRDVLEDLFRFAGKRLEDYLQLFPVDPITRYFFPNGKQLEVWRDLARTSKSIAEIEPRDVEGYLSFLGYAARQFRLTKPVYTYGAPPSWRSFLKIGLKDLFQVDLFRDLQTAINSHVSSAELRQFLSRFATYVGADPFRASAFLSVIPFVELVGGVWYPRGGIYAIAQALERLAIESGVKILTNKAVKEIAIRNRAVAGVILEDGAFVESDVVVSNVDVATTYMTLLPQKPPYQWVSETLQNAPSSYSAFILLLGIKGRNSNLGHHNILFSEDYRKEFSQISKGILPEDPTIYIAITSKADSQHAPFGCENWFVMVNVPALKPGFDWTREANSYREVILRKIKKFGFDIEGNILSERVITPMDLQQWSGAFRGALYGISMNDWSALFRRPHPIAKNPAGLYFVGGTTHPGGGIPLVMLSGKLVAELVEQRAS